MVSLFTTAELMFKTSDLKGGRFGRNVYAWLVQRVDTNCNEVVQAVIKHFFNIGKHDGIPGIILHLSVVVCYYRNFWDSDSENLDIHESDLAIVRTQNISI